jgi:hypothetical protein
MLKLEFVENHRCLSGETRSNSAATGWRPAHSPPSTARRLPLQGYPQAVTFSAHLDHLDIGIRCHLPVSINPTAPTNDCQEPWMSLLCARTLSRTSWLAKRPKTKRKRMNDECPIESFAICPPGCRLTEDASCPFCQPDSRSSIRNFYQTHSPELHSRPALTAPQIYSIPTGAQH